MSVHFNVLMLKLMCTPIKVGIGTYATCQLSNLEGLLFVRDFSIENLQDFYLFLTGSTSFSVLLLIPLLITFFQFVHDFLCYFI